MTIPNIWGKSKNGNQTTNQIAISCFFFGGKHHFLDPHVITVNLRMSRFVRTYERYLTGRLTSRFYPIEPPYGGFLSHRGTPKSSISNDGIIYYKPTIFGIPPCIWKPPSNQHEISLSQQFSRVDTGPGACGHQGGLATRRPKPAKIIWLVVFSHPL